MSSRRSGEDDGLGRGAAASPGSARLPVVAALSLLLSIAASCGVEPRGPGAQPGQGGGSSVGPFVPEACSEEGATEECHVTLGQHDGVLSCFVGTKTCQGGRYTECADGTVSSFALPPGGDGSAPAQGEGAARPSDSELLSLSNAAPCANNPCDPSCQIFNETPLAGTAISLSPWSNGGLTALQNDPAGFITKGIKSPCARANDCQFNELCTNPSAGTCAHHKCAPGAALDSTCDPCVKDVCAVDPNCCKTAWSPSCVAKVHDVCGGFCDTSLPKCAHDPCFTGDPLAASCDAACVGAVCATKKACCTTAWDASCVALVPSVCKTTCPTQGVCKPWLPGATDQKCAAPDLTLGIPCTAAPLSDGMMASDFVAICNVGTQVAPAGLDVVAYASGAGFTGAAADPCKPTGTVKLKCGQTVEPISPGGCLNMVCTGLAAGDEILVNPPGATKAQECQCKNNWTIFSKDLACDQVKCSTATALCQTAQNSQTYTSNCPAGTRVQWGFLGWDTTTPSGTSVAFKARTADTAAGLTSATFHALGAAQSSPTNTHLCLIGSSCAVDLFTKLGGQPDAAKTNLELSITLKPNAAGTFTPAVHNWKLTYSCPPAE